MLSALVVIVVHRRCYVHMRHLQTKRTLRMLYSEHNKAGKELQRKIAKLKDENKDPSLPQKPPRVASNQSGPASMAPPIHPPSPPPGNVPSNLSDSQQTVDESFMLLAQRVSAYCSP